MAKQGRKPNPEPQAQGGAGAIAMRGSGAWRFDGLSELPSPFATGFADGSVPDDIRRRMLAHPKIYQNLNNLKAAILGDGGRVVPCVHPKHPQWELARDLSAFCAFALRHLQGSWHGAARQLLDAVHECHKVANVVYREQAKGEYRGYWTLERIQLLPNPSFRFLRDRTGAVPKLRVQTKDGPREFERDRFAVLTYRPVNDSPWGTTALPAIYEPWYRDVQADPEEMAYLAQFGRPTVVVVAPGPDANGRDPAPVPLLNADLTPKLDANNQPMFLPPAEAIAMKLQNYEAGSIVVLPGGSSFKLAEAQQGGDSFSRFRDANARAMASGIMGTDQLTEARQQLSSDNKGVAQGVAALGVTDGKRALEEMVENDLFTQLVRYNFGEAALDYLPVFDLGSGENGRLIALMNAVAGYVNNGAFDHTQWWGYCLNVGLPMPDPDAQPLVDPAAARSVGGAHGNTA